MNRQQRHRPSLETLEDRWCPSVSARVFFGNLVVVADTATTDLTVQQTGANAFKVTENGTPVSGGDFSGVTRNVILRLSGNDDTGVVIDLNGQTAPGDVLASLGGGTNDLKVLGGTGGGTVTGYLAVSGGQGADSVTLGDGTNALTVGGATAVGLDGGVADALEVSGAVTLKGSLFTTFVNSITLDDGSTLQRSAILVGGSGSNTVNLNGTINGSVLFFGSARSDAVDELNVNGSVGGSLTAYLDGVFGLFGYGGNDKATINGSVGGPVYLDAGGGADSVTFTKNATLSTSASNVVNLGAGDDTFTLEDRTGATQAVLPLKVDGGANGTAGDTFVGDQTQLTPAPKGFEHP
jgi:hypothetical protein